MFSLFYKRIRRMLSFNRRNVFWVAVHEVMSDQPPKYKPIEIGRIQTLVRYFEKDWYKFEKIKVNGEFYPYSWEYYVPFDGDHIEFFPVVETKIFSNAYIAKINAESEGGVLLRSAIVVEDPADPDKTKYYVDHDQALVVDGHTYQPLPMRWDGYEMSGSMGLPQMKVSTHNLGQQISDYVEEIDILENDVTLQLLHLDLLNDVQARDPIVLQVMSIESDDLFITFTLGLNLGLSDLLPRGVITKDEFPGIVDDIIRY